MNKPTVLVATALKDGCILALKQGQLWADGIEAKLAVCHVLPDLFAIRPIFPHIYADDALGFTALQDKAYRALDLQIHQTLGEDVELDAHVLFGTPHAGILNAAAAVDASLLVLGSDTTMTPRGLAVGVPERVARGAHCSVLVAKASGHGPVVACTDFSPASLAGARVAAAEAKRRGVELVVCHVVTSAAFASHWAEPAGEGGFIVSDLRNIASQALEHWVRELGAARGEILEGDAAEEIARFAAIADACLVVASKLGHSVAPESTLGSVAEALIASVPCSVLLAPVDTIADAELPFSGKPVAPEDEGDEDEDEDDEDEDDEDEGDEDEDEDDDGEDDEDEGDEDEGDEDEGDEDEGEQDDDEDDEDDEDEKPKG